MVKAKKRIINMMMFNKWKSKGENGGGGNVVGRYKSSIKNDGLPFIPSHSFNIYPSLYRFLGGIYH